MLPEEISIDDPTSDEHLRRELKFMRVDPTGQRADKMTIHLSRGGIEVEYYTMTCDECGGTGYYEDRGEVVCEDCGLVLGGDSKPVMFKDYSGSRGFSDQEDDIYYRSQMGPTGVA